jgi:uncharacterized membrane protein
MSNEQERLKQLRERQLADRDPLVKQKQFQRTTTQKERKARAKKLTFADIWRTIPHVYKTPFLLFLLGTLGMIILPILWISPWAFWVAVGATVFLVILGAIIGQAEDLRDELRDLSNH